MKVTSLVLAAIAFVCLAGCEEQKTKPTADPNAAKPAASSGTAAPAEKEAPKKEEKKGEGGW